MLVKGEGPLNARIYLIGECPGVQEEASGRPFVGGSGMELNKILINAGIDRKECYIDNVIQTRPKENDFSMFYKDKAKTIPTDDLLKGHERIRELIRQNRPSVVCALGNESLYALTGKKAITKWRGSILGCHSIKVIPSIHPAMVMRQYEYFPIAVFDLKRVKEESLTSEWPEPYVDNFICNPSYEKIMETLALLRKEKYVCFDIETQQNQIVCLGFGWSKVDAICIPISFGGNSWWTEAQELEIVKAIRELFLTPGVNFIAQNAQFDMIYLEDAWGVKVPGLWLDTMIGFHAIYPELPKGLDFLSSIYTHRPYHKDDARLNPGPDGLWHYNCIDTTVTWECAMAIHEELKEFGTLKFYEEHSHKLIAPLIKMQRRGVKIDIDYRATLDIGLEKKIIELQAKVDAAVGHPLNVNSPLQMKNFLYKELGLPEQTKRKTGNVTADEDALNKLSKQFPNPLFDVILEIRHIRKVLSTYVRATLDGDGRLRTSYVITGTETGRLASRGSVYGTGTNMQNIDRDVSIRRMFIADAGKKFINADLSQAEARVVAYLAREDRLKAVFAEGGDIHKRNASIIFHKSVDSITSEERQLAKTLIHACLTPTHQVLTPNGWVGINTVRKGDLIADWDNGKMHFSPVLENYVYDYTGDLVHLSGRGIDAVMTPEHRIPYKTQDINPLQTCYARDIPNGARIPVNGEMLSTEYIPLTTLRLAVAIQADGCIRGNMVRFHLVKERKQERLRILLEGIPYSEVECKCQTHEKGGVFFDVKLSNIPELADVIDYEAKNFKPILYRILPNLKEAFLDEVVLWDGWTGDTGRKEYCTTNQYNAEFVQTLSHLSQKQSLISSYVDSRGNRKVLYKVSFNRRKYARTKNAETKKVPYEGKVFCVSVLSSWFLIKNNDKISVTGNSNYGIGVRKFAQTIGGTEDRARQLLNLYHANYPRIRMWHMEVEAQLRRSRTLETPFGRKRMFFGRWGEDLTREAVAYVPQSTVGDALNFGIIRCANAMPQGWEMLMQNHDAVLLQVPEATDPQHIIKFINHYFHVPIEIYGETLIIPLDIKEGINWGEMHKLEIPHAQVM